MKITIELNRVKITKDIPSSWDEVSFETFLKIDDCGNDQVKVISLFTGIELSVLKKARIFDMGFVFESLSFLNKHPETRIPKTVLNYPVPVNLEFQQVQQYLDLKLSVEESRDMEPLDKLKRYSLYCAIYACPSKYGSYGIEHAEEMAPEFMKAPCTEVLGIGNFTLARLAALNLNMNPSSPSHLTQVQKLKLVLKTWRQISVHMQRWFTWKKKPVQVQKNY